MIKYLALFLVIVISGCAAGQPGMYKDDLQAACRRVQDIKSLPFKGEHVEDDAYNEIVGYRDSIVPCLINKITDTSAMDDPRQAPAYPDIKVGDVAFFVLCDIVNVPLDKVLPAEVFMDYEKDGVYAYFRYTSVDKNRTELQKNVSEWYYNR